jgi:hypothetical protein
MNDTVTIVLSSGFISAMMTVLTLMFTLGRYKHKIDNLDKMVEKWIDKTDVKISSFSERLAKLEAGIERDRVHNKYIKADSPLNLTDKGKVVLLDSKGKDYIDFYKNELMSDIKRANPKTAYDIQELSKKVIQEKASNDSFIPIKDYAYKEGENLESIIEVMGIYLRDIVLKEWGFEISDIKD